MSLWHSISLISIPFLSLPPPHSQLELTVFAHISSGSPTPPPPPGLPRCNWFHLRWISIRLHHLLDIHIFHRNISSENEYLDAMQAVHQKDHLCEWQKHIKFIIRNRRSHLKELRSIFLFHCKYERFRPSKFRCRDTNISQTTWSLKRQGLVRNKASSNNKYTNRYFKIPIISSVKVLWEI